jgi:hypothetical protein
VNLHMVTKYAPIGVVAILLSATCGAQTNDDAAIVKDFQARVDKYLALRKKQDVADKQTNSAQQIAQQKQEAVEKIKAARPTAHQGDIFTPAIAKYFKKQIETTMRRSAGDKIRASLRHAEPLTTVSLEVNKKYPKNLPLQSTPPTLLLNLPLLPKELQYRIVGSTLFLYDEPSDLVVDLIPDAMATM